MTWRPERGDIATRDDIVRLVDTFYQRIRADAVLGPIFDDVAHVDWSEHLPKMYDFWEAVLFGRAAFKGNPLAVHRGLALQTPLTRAHFDRWVAVFHGTIDDLFTGPVAEETRIRAARISATMQMHLEGYLSDSDRVA